MSGNQRRLARVWCACRSTKSSRDMTASSPWARRVPRACRNDAVMRKVRTGLWIRHARGVYQSAQHRRTHSTRFRVAMMSLGDDAIAHGLSAAWWHGLIDLPPGRHQITIPAKRSVRRAGVDLRRRSLDASDVLTVRGLLTTGIPLTVLEAGDSILMDQALQTRTTMAKLEASYARNRNCAGARRAGGLVRVARTCGRSEAERLIHGILKPIPGWTPQLRLGNHYLDVAFDDLRIGVEVDGWRWHKDSRRNNLDLQRHNSVVLSGWTILRYDWHRLMDDADDGVLREVADAVQMRSG